MTRQLTEDVHWIDNCHPDGGRHMHVSEYLIRGEDGTILIDSGSSHYADSIIEETNALTDGAGPDVVILLHSTLPHTENVPAFEAEWGATETVAATGRFPEIVGLPTATPRQLNRPVEFGGRTFTCIHPLLTDVTVSQWVYDRESGVLFTAETFGHYHDPGRCELMSDEMEGSVPAEHIEAFYMDKLPFVDYLDHEKLANAIETMFDVLDVTYIAPAHGNPVAAADIEDYVEEVMRALRRPAAEP